MFSSPAIGLWPRRVVVIARLAAATEKFSDRFAHVQSGVYQVSSFPVVNSNSCRQMGFFFRQLTICGQGPSIHPSVSLSIGRQSYT